MRIAYFNCFAGIAGDMTIAALLDAGLDFEFLTAELTKLSISGDLQPSEYQLTRTNVKRHGIAATKFDVAIDHHEHTHTAHSHASHRTLADITHIIESAGLSPRVTKQACGIFRRLAVAEAKVHATTVDNVHFHEVGAVDSIIDVVGVCIGLEALDIDEVYSSSIRVGTGSIRTAHGVMPVPAPATLELLSAPPSGCAVTVEHTDLPFEMVTPTGAAIITECARSFGSPPPFVPHAVGYGAGSRDSEQIANLLRVEIGETVSSLLHDQVVVLETNIDDMTSEVYGYLMDRLMATGAKDVFFSSVMMKKNRPGVVVHVIADDTTKDTLIGVLFSETSTLGVRVSTATRRILPREASTVETPWGTVRVKRAEWDGIVRTTPEYDDCAAIAREHDIPILRVYQAVQHAISH